MTEKDNNHDDPDSSVYVATSRDEPIKTSTKDVLDRGPFIQRLCQALIDSKTQKATGVVVGVTGPWGSGKSSILNLAYEHLVKQDEPAVVVRFNPWLVSGRNELIGQFFAEFIGALNKDEVLKNKAKELIKNLTPYAAALTPIANLLLPFLGTITSNLIKAAKKDKGLSSRRNKLFKTLEKIDFPIVVFIDELDRVEDKEIKAVAQLISSIGNFPNVSYLLAFDVERVAEALGDKDKGKGQAYLEKIVQFQIPLPITFDDELRRLFEAEIGKLSILPQDWQSSPDFNTLIGLLIPALIKTPRDVKRLVSVFNIWARMVENEVDLFDVLGLAALQVKAPDVVDKIRADLDSFIKGVRGGGGHDLEKPSKERISGLLGEKIKEHLNEAEYEAVSKVLVHLLPCLDDVSTQYKVNNRIRYRTPLLTALRLGLIPGDIPTKTIKEFLLLNSKDITKRLKHQLKKGNFKSFYDKLSVVYLSSSNINHMKFWKGVSAFLKKPDNDWLNKNPPMSKIAFDFCQLSEKAMRNNEEFLGQAKDVFMSLQKAGDITLTAFLLNYHITQHGLFGLSKRGENIVFLTEEETNKEVRDAAKKYRTAYLEGNFIAGCWGPEPILIMIYTGVWDDECKNRMEDLIKDDKGLDGFTLIFFGGYSRTERPTIEKIVSYDNYIERLRTRVVDQTDQGPHETVRQAIERALE